MAVADLFRGVRRGDAVSLFEEKATALPAVVLGRVAQFKREEEAAC